MPILIECEQLSLLPPHSNSYPSCDSATVSGDRHVRVFDDGEDYETSALGQEIGQEYCLSTLRSHEDRVKRIATEESPDRFLTVSEHDLRTPHVCGDHCPAPLKFTICQILSSSRMTKIQLIGTAMLQGYLFDRRFTGRDIPDEWGRRDEGLVSCVLRFGRTNQRMLNRSRAGPREHITGAKISAENSHEVLLSCSSDGVYLFSMLHDPESSSSPSSSTIVPPNLKRRRISRESPSTSSTSGRMGIKERMGI
ncbi:hypothetical protein C8J55DRAFT_517385 [Lentinula edodes]|uniref:WD40 repeat-like protein n=1 Tax=Lentinula lateritia TaxID=40482 RepID=A0A9W9A721_9AGAR|nr:hypothetical protein C8J55DRAFT_517385 [Lentinula edodes]